MRIRFLDLENAGMQSEMTSLKIDIDQLRESKRNLEHLLIMRGYKKLTEELWIRPHGSNTDYFVLRINPGSKQAVWNMATGIETASA